MKRGLKRLGKMMDDLFTPNVDEKIVSLFEPGVTQFQKILLEGQTFMANEMRMAKGQGEMEINENGVKRESNKGRGRFDLFPYEALEELAKWYEAGAEKYGDRNWEKGISVKDCVNRMARHSAKACNGWMDEGPFAHFVAVIWNAMAAITWIKRNPYQNDFFREEYLNALMLIKNSDVENTEEKPFDLTYVPTSPALVKDYIKTVEEQEKGMTITLMFKTPEDFEMARMGLDRFILPEDYTVFINRPGAKTNEWDPERGGFVRTGGDDKTPKEE